MTLRLTADEDETLARLARSFRTSKNNAAATAIEIAAPKQNHEEFVTSSTTALLRRYAALMVRLADA